MSQPWRWRRVRCEVCGHVWYAVFPDATPALECPLCGHMNPNPEEPMTPPDELDRADVRERLRALRQRAAMQALNDLAMTPLQEGVTPPPANRHIDAFGRGPGSPFYQPDFRPPWAPDWQPPADPLQRRWDEAFRPDDDDGIEWRFA